MVSRSKKSIKNEYAPMFRTLYWIMIGFFVAVVTFILIDGLFTAKSAYEKQERLTQEYKAAMTQYILPNPNSKKSDKSASEEDEKAEGSEDDKNNQDDIDDEAGSDQSNEDQSDEDKPVRL